VLKIKFFSKSGKSLKKKIKLKMIIEKIPNALEVNFRVETIVKVIVVNLNLCDSHYFRGEIVGQTIFGSVDYVTVQYFFLEINSKPKLSLLKTHSYFLDN
jgi:hypothetical protein